MRCTCGRERSEGSVLCQMTETCSGLFLVDVYDGKDRLLAKSEGALPPKEALDFIDTASSRDSFSRHFHWKRRERPEGLLSKCLALKGD